MPIRTGLVLGLLALAGCSVIDPYERPGTWRPTDVNDSNLAAMIAVPGDLARGTEDLTGNGQPAAAALDRLRRDRVRQLPNTAISRVGPSLAGGGGGEGAPATGGTGPGGGGAGAQ